MNISTEFKPVLTKAALALQKKQNSSAFQALVFQEPQTHGKSATDNDNTAAQGAPKSKDAKTDAISNPEFDIKKARHEVLNFAMNNQRVIKNKRKMEIFQLVKLGMKPPKKACKNYKDLQAERQRLRTIREERKQFHQLGKNQTGAASVRCRSQSKTQQAHRQKKRAPVANIDQHYGNAKPKFKNRK
ncbi:uncharacterized protein C1orf131 [Drosophila tropicalis]|uniref:uncharacterized protein C1orf131 n=1 Tax=Drosophila tropicalis TaxID=46794 RepID=UPI0035ABFC60